MDIVCQSCSTRLSIPDDKLPKNVPVVTGKCPKCQNAIEIRLDGGQAAPPPAAAASPAPASEPSADAPPPSGSPAAAPAAQAPAAQAPANGASEPRAEATAPPPPAPAPAEPPPPPPPMEEFVAGQKLALVCLESPESRATVKESLEQADYKVSVPANPEEAVQRLRRTKYELLILDDAYGGSPEKNPVLTALEPMAMPMRRHMCVGLVGKDFWTMDNMTAFSKSVHFTIAEKDLPRIQEIVKQAVADNEQFYHVFREALRDAGKA